MKRLMTLVVAVLLLIAGAPVSLAKAQSNSLSSCPSALNAPGFNVYDPILSGLWSGINLDVSNRYTTGGVAVSPQSVTTGCTNGTASSSRSNENGSGNSTTGPSAQTPTPSSQNLYVAMGDSVAAGVGLSEAGRSRSSCGRTPWAYPNSVASAMNLQLKNVACAGAASSEVFGSQLRDAFQGGKPNLITITAGANDARWIQFLSTCYFSDCATADTTSAANIDLKNLQSNLITGLNTVSRLGSESPPTVIMTGYYNPISMQCAAKFSNNVTADEVNWMTAEVNALNETIQDVVVLYPFARFAPVDFTGHDICSADSWVQGQDDKAPFHPTATGQQVIAESVLGSLGR